MKKSIKVKIELELKGDPTDTRAIKEAVYDYLNELMDDESLDFEVENERI